MVCVPIFIGFGNRKECERAIMLECIFQDFCVRDKLHEQDIPVETINKAMETVTGMHIIFLDLESEQIFCSHHHSEAYFESSKTVYTFREFMQLVHPYDIAVAQAFLRSFYDGAPYTSVDLRLLASEHKSIWVTLNGQVLTGTAGNKNLVICTLIPTGRMAEVDSLTQIKNIVAYNRFLNSGLREKKPFSIFFMYIIDFANANYQYSYKYGNKILRDFAHYLTRYFEMKQEKRYFRIGGHTFALISDMLSREDMELFYLKCNRWLQGNYKLKLSLGMFRYPDDVDDLDCVE